MLKSNFSYYLFGTFTSIVIVHFPQSKSNNQRGMYKVMTQFTIVACKQRRF